MDCIAHITFALLAVFGSQAAGKLIERPRDTEVKVNHSIYFNCSTDRGPTAIFWFHGTKYVYTGGVILDPYHDRFEIDQFDGNGTYTYNLVIHSVQPGDAGKYICAEDEGSGEQYSIQLIVLEDDPICRSNRALDEVIGENTCNIEQDALELECRVRYHGNILPRMEWNKVGENSSMSSEVSIATSGNQFVSTLKLKGEIALDNSSYVCDAKRATQEPIKCTSEIINIIYALNDNSTVNNTIDDEIHCYANTSQSCNYRWKWLQDNDHTIESSTSVLKARKPGWHRCEAECYLRNITCVLLVKRAIVDGETESYLTRNIIISVAVSVGVTLVVAVALICIVLWNARKRNKTPGKELAHLVEPIPLLSSVQYIFGLAVMGLEVFISRQRRGSIEVYDSSTFNFKRKIEVDGMTNPESIVSCSINNCLYAFDWEYLSELTAILKIDPTDGKLINTWIVNGRGGRLSVANDTNLILNINFEAKLKEYKADGTLIRVIDLGRGTNILRAWHAVKLPNGHFVICQGCQEDPIDRICLLSTKIIIDTPMRIDEVQILRVFGGEEEGSVNKLFGPVYLSVDKEGSIMVSDHKTFLLSSNLDKPQIIISEEDGLEKSWRTCFDESTGQWFVADYLRVMVCRVQDKVERSLYNLTSH